MSLKDFAKDLLLYLPLQVGLALLSFGMVPIMTRLFSPEEFGKYALVMASVSILVTLAGPLTIAIMRFYAAMSEHEVNVLVRTLVYAQLVLTGMTGVIAFSLAGFLLPPFAGFTSLKGLIYIGVLIFLVQSFFNLLNEMLRARFDARAFSLFMISAKILGVGLGLVLAVGYDLRISGMLWGIFLGVVITMPFLWKRSIAGVEAIGPVSKSLLRELSRYGIPLIIGEISKWLLDQSNRYLMQLFYGFQEVGIYSATYIISWSPVILLHGLIRYPLGPRLVSLWENEMVEASGRLLNSAARLYLLVGIPLVAGISILAKPTMMVLTGSAFSDAYKIVPWIAISALFLGLQQSFNYVLLLWKRSKVVLYWLVICGTLNVGMNLLLFPLFSYKIAAVTTLICYALLCVALAVASRKYFCWPFPWLTMLRSLFATGIMCIVLFFLLSMINLSPFWTLSLAVPVGILIYGWSIWGLGEISPMERQAMAATVRQMLSR